MAYGNRKTSGEAGISFPLLECWSPITNNATFAANVNGSRVMCRVETAALSKSDPSLADEPMKALAAHRVAIQATARRLIEKQRFEEDGSILIRKADI